MLWHNKCNSLIIKEQEGGTDDSNNNTFVMHYNAKPWIPVSEEE
jgi:hypothetical protein